MSGITHNELPKAVETLLEEVREVKQMVVRINGTSPSLPIDIDRAAEILGKSAKTIYHLAQNNRIPHYRQGRTLYFFEDELAEWVKSGKVKTLDEIRQEAEKMLYKGTRYRVR